MKKSLLKLSIVLCTTSLVVFSYSCKKTLEGITDCLAETSLTSINASVDPNNTKVYTFNVSYGGTHNLGTVKWKFGDGSETTSIGSAAVTHTFKEGTFVVVANADITKNDDKCDSRVEKTVVVN